MCYRAMISAVCLILFLSLAPGVTAQDGRWVEFDLSSLGCYDQGIGARGDGIVCFAPAQCQYFLIFDIEVGEWLEIDLGAVESFEFFDTEDNVVFGYSDNLILGYSSLTQTWDSVYYSGTVLDKDFYESYGIKGNLAFFVTDNTFYVFDAEVGEWVSDAITLPADFSYGQYHVGNNYIAMSLVPSTPFYGAKKNYVYSAELKAFNYLEEGVYIPNEPMKNGFANILDLDGSGDTYLLVGYSALTNSFESFTHDATDQSSVAYAICWPHQSRTVFSAGFAEVEPHVSVTIGYYSYDTRRGIWDFEEYFFDQDVESANRYIHIGGQGAMDNSLYVDDNRHHWFFYHGDDGSYTEQSSPLVYKSTTSSWSCGGSVFCAFDTLQAWGYDFKSRQSSLIDLEYDKTARISLGENFASLVRYTPDVDMMRIYFYNSDNNNWSSVEIPEDHHADPLMSADYYMLRETAGNNMVYYSGRHDQILSHDFNDGEYISYGMKGNMGYAKSSQTTVLFDGVNMVRKTLPFDIGYGPTGLGFNSAIYYNDDTKTAYGYSSLSQSFTEHSYTDDPGICRDTGYIEILTTGFNYNKVHTYNSLADSWVVLEPVGNNQSILIGYRSALVVRYQNGTDPDYIYAFDPQLLPTDIAESYQEVDRLPEKFALGTNYPNPFNPSTTIEYSVPYRCEVTIEVFNILGKKVAVLKDSQEHAAGHYEVTWDGKNYEGHSAASGIYFYRLKSEDKSMVRKMLLLK